MSGEFYDHTTYPANGVLGSASAMRTELESIQTGFDKLAGLSGNGGKIIAVNAGATAYEALTTTGTGSAVRATSPTLVTPVLGVATATSLNKLTITAPATSCTFTLLDGKTFTVNNTLTLAGTDGSTLNIGTGGTLGTAAYTASSDYASSTSYAFKTISVSGQSDVVAESLGDTLTLVAGTNIVLTTNAGTDTVTITSAGGSLHLLATLTPTVAANVDALTTFTSSYDNYVIVGEGLLPSADDYIRIRFAVAGTTDTGSKYYDNTNWAVAATSILVFSSASSTGTGAGFVAHVTNANDATRVKTVHIDAVSDGGASPNPSFTASNRQGAYVATNAISGVRFFWNGGANFQAVGKIRIFGYDNT